MERMAPSVCQQMPLPTHQPLLPLTGPSAYQHTSPPLTSPSVCHHSLLRWVEPARTQVGPTEQSGHRVGGILRPHLHCVGEKEEEGLAGEAHSTQMCTDSGVVERSWVLLVPLTRWPPSAHLCSHLRLTQTGLGLWD